MEETKKFLLSQEISAPEIGIILGTGLGKLIDHIQIEKTIPYEKIPHFPLSTVESHSGNLVYGTLEGKKVMVMQGRFHLYEGYSFQEITYPVRVMKSLGVNTLLLSNAAGALNTDFKKAEIMLLDDHINLQGGSPLIGKNHDELGPRFPDMAEPYTLELNKKMKRIAQEKGIQLHEGVYVAVAGPQLETRAEYRFLHRIGADAVGMSTAPEATVAVHAGMQCCAVSVLTDECDPDHLEKVNIADILAAAAQAEPNMIELFKGLVKEI